MNKLEKLLYTTFGFIFLYSVLNTVKDLSKINMNIVFIFIFSIGIFTTILLSLNLKQDFNIKNFGKYFLNFGLINVSLMTLFFINFKLGSILLILLILSMMIEIMLIVKNLNQSNENTEEERGNISISNFFYIAIAMCFLVLPLFINIIEINHNFSILEIISNRK